MKPLYCLISLVMLWGATTLYCPAQQKQAAPTNTAPQEINIPEGWLPSAMVLELTEQIRVAKGEDKALEFLKGRLLELSGKTNELEVLFFAIWKEAQFGTGFKDVAWGSRLNDTAFTSTFQAGYYSLSFEIVGNLCTRLWQSRRFGRLAEVYATVEDAYSKGGLVMDPTTYPDRGPAIPSLPMIRHRAMPVTTPYAKVLPPGAAPARKPAKFAAPQAALLLGYADHLMVCGDWRRCLEWKAWIRKWASDKEGNPIKYRSESWYKSTLAIAGILDVYGFHEEALALVDQAAAAPHGHPYRGRMKIRAECTQLVMRLKAGRSDPGSIDKLRHYITTIENHLHMGKNAAHEYRLYLANALFELGQTDEAEMIEAQLIAEGYVWAHWNKISRHIKTGKTEGVEEEIVGLLNLTRQNGHKYDEIGLYAMYADFLELTERFQEALMMRRETIRLARDFGGFTKVPIYLAQLSSLLRKLGDAELAEKIANEALASTKAQSLPPSIIAEMNKILTSGASPIASRSDSDDQQPMIDLQPQRGLVIPVEGVPWTNYLTLANPGVATARGNLLISGIPLTAVVDEQSGDIRIELAKEGGGRVSLSLDLAPSTYRLISISAAAENRLTGEMRLAWQAADGRATSEAVSFIDKREEGVSGAVIQAGDYQSNPFYGVPLHLSYVTGNQAIKSFPIRFRASQPTRIEIYRLDGSPLAVDGSANGSLLDQGDEIFADSDGAGNLKLGLENGMAAFRIIAYPDGRIAKEGLEIAVEVFDSVEWQVHSKNRIKP